MRARLRAYHDTDAPDAVTAALRVPPTRTQLAGTPSHFPELGDIPASGWFLYSDPHVPSSGSIDDHLAFLLTPLTQHVEAYRDLLALGWEFDVGVGCSGSHRTLTLSRRIVAMLAELELGLLISFWGDERADDANGE